MANSIAPPVAGGRHRANPPKAGETDCFLCGSCDNAAVSKTAAQGQRRVEGTDRALHCLICVLGANTGETLRAVFRHGLFVEDNRPCRNDPIPAVKGDRKTPCPAAKVLPCKEKFTGADEDCCETRPHTPSEKMKQHAVNVSSCGECRPQEQAKT